MEINIVTADSRGEINFEKFLIESHQAILIKSNENATLYKLPLKNPLYFFLFGNKHEENGDYAYLRIYKDETLTQILYDGLTPLDSSFVILLITHLSEDFRAYDI